MLTGKQRMLNAYRGLANDRVPIAPEFWYYYTAKLLGVDMIAFEREVPFHQALKTTFQRFDCDGWALTFGGPPNDRVSGSSSEHWLDRDTLEVHWTTRTPLGDLTSAQRYTRDEPSWAIERPIKDPARDLPAFLLAHLDGQPEAFDATGATRAWEEVGDAYLLEFFLGMPFFDWYAGAREGGFLTALDEFMDPALEETFMALRARYEEFLLRWTRALCEKTPFESFFIGCSYSCNSLLGPSLWRQWDKPVLAAVAAELHRHGRLLHLHYHGRCFDTVADLAEIGVDCVCPFERPPGGDVTDLAEVRHRLRERVTINGNVHTVDTLIRGTADDVRREVEEIFAQWGPDPRRLILGTGDQVGRETPEENLYAMIDTGKRLGRM
jgi:hypothetical protein